MQKGEQLRAFAAQRYGIGDIEFRMGLGAMDHKEESDLGSEFVLSYYKFFE